jgi:hypothetical protein
MWIVVGGLAAIGIMLAKRPSIDALQGRGVSVGATPARIAVSAVAPDAICVTKGALSGSSVTVPTFRAVALRTSGDAAALGFIYRGGSRETRALASGQVRRQIGLKLRAANGCNLVYVMWRLDPSPQIEVSIKVNPGKRVHRECGAGGYTKLRSTYQRPVSAPREGATHWIQAEIVGDQLLAWIDGKLAWSGTLPQAAGTISGPSGFRSDNVAYDVIGLWAPVGHGAVDPHGCVAGGED